MHEKNYSIRYLRHVFLSLLTMICNISYAYNFEVDGLCYNIIANDQVEVTFKKTEGGSYSGNLVIPETVIFNNVVYNVTSIGDWAFYNCNGLIGALTIPKSITAIGESAFSGCSSLSGDLNIPNSVTTIGRRAFYNCSGFKGSLIIPNTIKSIEGGTFFGCSGLTGELKIPITVYSIGGDAFRDCGGFTSELVLPNSLTTLGGGAFYGCSGLIGTLVIPDNIELIDDNTFKGCTGFTSLVIPNTTKTIGHYTFQGCNGLSSLVIPNKTKTIGRCSFANCMGLITVILGNNMNSIKGSAFGYCENLEHVYSNMETPCTVYLNAFQGISPNAILHIPKGTKEKYNQSVNWVYYFKEIEEDSGVDLHTLSIKASGNGSVSYGGNTIRNSINAYSVEDGTTITISFIPDEGYRIKGVEVNDKRVSLESNSYTLRVNENTTIKVVFEEIPKVTYNLTIFTAGNGYALFNEETIREGKKEYVVFEGDNITISFFPDTGSKISSVKVNGSDVNVESNSYTINEINSDNNIEVSFEELEKTIIVDNVLYEVISHDDRTLKVGAGDYGIVLVIPELLEYGDKEWTVIGFAEGALDNCEDLAAIIWNPEIPFNVRVSNPNLLLYVKNEAYAPVSFNNVIVNGYSQSITLTEAQSRNNFYCPEAFAAQSISYTHNYLMKTGLHESRGWETIALPFDVQKISHSSKGEIVPFAKWTSDSSTKPFWLYELGGSGFVEAEAIKANSPYIISMPNNEAYPGEYQLTGRVTFSAENVEVKKSDEVQTTTYGSNTFMPSFINMDSEVGYYALNVNNDYEYYRGAENEGSMFILNLRKIHPFEAYMTSTSGTRSIDISEGMTTDIRGVDEIVVSDKAIKVYDISRRLIKTNTTIETIRQELPAGVYIVNNRKMIIK